MIRRNEPFEEEKQQNTQAKRYFTKILIAFKPFWQELEADVENHTARGLLFAKDDKPHIVELTVDDFNNRVLLMVRLRAADRLSDYQVQSLFELQHRTVSSFSIVYDIEFKMILLRSCSILPSANTCMSVAPVVVAELKELLKNNSLDHLLV